MGKLIPTAITTQMLLVLTLELVSIYLKEDLKTASGNRVSIQQLLLKKPQTAVTQFAAKIALFQENGDLPLSASEIRGGER